MSPSNPAERIGLTALAYNAPLARLLRACGTPEAYITGGASDYDRFAALAAALPLCEGHPLRDEVDRILQHETGLIHPLCPHTAPALWQAFAERRFLGGADIQAGNAPAGPPAIDRPPCCPPVAPAELSDKDCHALPPPSSLITPADTYDTWARAWITACHAVAPGQMATMCLSTEDVFRRPDPYHAAEAVRTLATAPSGGRSQGPDRGDAYSILLAQSLRLLGEFACKQGMTVLLRGGTPSMLSPLVAYLKAEKRLPNLIWIPNDPRDAAALCGLCPSVRTGLDLSNVSPGSPEETACIRTYAAVAPIGRAVCLR